MTEAVQQCPLRHREVDDPPIRDEHSGVRLSVRRCGWTLIIISALAAAQIDPRQGWLCISLTCNLTSEDACFKVQI